MAYKESYRSPFKSTGDMKEIAKFRASKSHALIGALQASSVKEAVAIVNAAGIVSRVIAAEVPPPTIQRPKHRERFVLQSKKRTLPKSLLGREDKGYGSTCPIRVIRKSINVNNKLAYMGGGVWA